MKKTIILFLLAGIIYSAHAQPMKFTWITQVGGNNWDVVTSMTELSDGNIAVAGTYYDSITIAGKTFISKGSRDCFIGIFNPKGEFVKAASFGGEGYEYIRNVIAAENGGLTAVLQYNQTLNVGGQTLPKKGLNNYAFTFFDKNLDVVDKAIVGSNKESRITGYQRNTDGSYYFTGWFEDSLLVDNKYYRTQGDDNIFSGSLSKGAKLNWFKNFNAVGNDKSFAAKTDKSGNGFAMGITNKGDFEGVKKPKTTDETMSHLYVMQNAKDGTVSDLIYPIYGNEIEPVDILRDSTDLWILANFKYSAFVNGTELLSYGMGDILLLKYNQQNKEIKYYQIEGLGNETAVGLVKSGKQVIVAGSFTDEITVAGQTAKPEEFGTDIFVAAFDENCAPVALLTLKGDKSEFPCSIISSGTGIYIAGEFTGTLSSDQIEFNSKGNEDIFIARIENCSTRQPLKIRVSDYAIGKKKAGWVLDAGDGFSEYAWDENLSKTKDLIVTNPGEYKVTVIDKAGCVFSDSITLMAKKSGEIITETKEAHLFNLYPTLTKSTVYWSPSSEWVSQPANVKVFDVTGKVVIRQNIAEIYDTEYQIDLSNQPEGPYVVEISGKGFRETTKIVLKK